MHMTAWRAAFVVMHAGEGSVACTMIAADSTDAAMDESDDESEVFDAEQLRAVVDAMEDGKADPEEAAAAAR